VHLKAGQARSFILLLDLRLGGPAPLWVGGLTTAALLGVGKNLLLHYGGAAIRRMRRAFRCTSLWRLNSFPGNASEVPRLVYAFELVQPRALGPL
jgi:hypothetical protein